MSYEEMIGQLQAALAGAADEKKKQWWEKYMKGVIPFRGLGIPRIREILVPWRQESGLAEWKDDDQLAVALALFEEPLAEDKLAGILYLQLYLADRLPWERLMPKYASIYERRLIFDWYVCDWFCVRVLGPTLKENGEPYARALAKWKDSAYLWQARSALVPFTAVAGDASYYPYIEEIGTTLIRRPERFGKTAVGWVLRDVSKHDRDFVESFIEAQARHFSLESVRNATKYFEEGPKRALVTLVRNSKRIERA